MFVSNIFRRADKDVKYTLTGVVGNAGVTDVRGYSKAVIQFSGTNVCQINGYIDKDSESAIIQPMVTTIGHRPIIDVTRVTERTIIVDVSDLSVLFIYFAETYTGDVFIHLTQDEIRINRHGITRIATKYINVVSGTDAYESGYVTNDEIKHFRFIAVEIKRRDVDGYRQFSGRALLYYNVHKEQGAGPEFNQGEEIINVSGVNFANSGWLENYATEFLAVDVFINGTEYDGALLEINFLGIA